MEAAMSSLDFEHDGRDFRIMSHHKTFAPSRVGAFLFEQGLFIPRCSAGYGVDGSDAGAVTKMMERFHARITSGEIKLRAGVAVEILPD
jgi:selenocysteine lyase/cysteine desulfurase